MPDAASAVVAPPVPGPFLRRFALWAALFALSLAALAAALDRPADDPGAVVEGVDVEAFVQPGCRHCTAAQRFLAALRNERPDLVVVTRDVARDRQARSRLEALVEQAGVPAAATPGLLVRGTLIVGWRDEATTGARVRDALRRPRPSPGDRASGGAEAGKCPLDLDGDDEAPAAREADRADVPECASAVAEEAIDLPLVGRVRARDVGLPLFTVVLGLVDGVNPCAMWVLLFLLSLLVNLHSRTKMLAIAGTFVLVSGLCYFAFMAAWMSFFDLVGEARVVQVALGALAVFVGAVHGKDFFAFHRGVTLSIPESRKPGLYARVTAVLRANRLAGAILGVVVLAFLVNTVELLCTAGLPAVYTAVLAGHDMPRWSRYAYLALYQVCYMLDDSIMLVIAIVTLSRRRLQERGGRWLKLVSGVVISAIGLILLFRPAWLYW